MTNILRLALPFTIWLIGFSAIYALQGLTCSRHWPEELEPRLALIGGAAVFVVIQGLALAALLALQSQSRFVQTAATILGTAALAAALWTVLPVLTITVCG
ncbi:hypothetical protein [Tabrizicola sp.]|uniref:hypothetical protein n=1 Tax=Tabrizicola sp. TaxID=2005166 RepID=UPI0027377316|nr:hypothetical protein [Tabrizicola sp.]MDP3195169.1 hypothetical protein [Tabrizicola sp.]